MAAFIIFPVSVMALEIFLKAQAIVTSIQHHLACAKATFIKMPDPLNLVSPEKSSKSSDEIKDATIPIGRQPRARLGFFFPIFALLVK